MNSRSKELYGQSYMSDKGQNSKDISKVLVGALAGAVAGSVAGALFTEKGIEARKRVSDGSKHMASNVKEKVSDIKEGITDRLESVKEKYEAAKDSASSLIKKGKQKVGFSKHDNAYHVNGGQNKGVESKLLIGALGASVAGLLIWGFATEKGKESRKRLGKGSKKIATDLKSKLSNIADGVVHTYETAKEGAVDLLEKEKLRTSQSFGNISATDTTAADLWEG